jgi:hypothetical protein
MISITTLPTDRQEVISYIWGGTNIELTCVKNDIHCFECRVTSTFKYITSDELVKIQSFAMAKGYKVGFDMDNNTIVFNK